MSQVLGSNLSSIKAQNSLRESNNAMQTALDRLSSGNRINSAIDDAPGLAISNKFSSQIRGLEQAIRNSNDAISVAQISEGAMTEMSELLLRLRSLSIQSSNGSNTSTDRSSLNNEAKELVEEIDRIADSIDFNGSKLLNGELSNKLFQIGYKANDTVSLSIKDVRTSSLGSNNLELVNLENSIVNALDGDLDGTESGLAAQTITLSGTSSSTIEVAADASMKDIANSINSTTGSTGVKAEAKNSVRLDSLSHDGQVSFNLYGDNKASSSTLSQVTADVTTSDLTNLKNAINNTSGTTGITADFVNGSDKSGLVLTHADGEDIGIENFASSASNEDVSLRVTSYADTEFYSKELEFITRSNVLHVSASPFMGGDISINSNTYNLASNAYDSANEIAAALNDEFNGDFGLKAKAYTEIRFDYSADSVAAKFKFSTDISGGVTGADAFDSTGIVFTSAQDFVNQFNNNYKDKLSDLRANLVSGNTVALISETGKNIAIDPNDPGDLSITNWSNGTAGTTKLLDADSFLSSNTGLFGGTVFLESDQSFTINSGGSYTSSTGSASTTEAYSSSRHQFLVNDDAIGGDQNDSVTVRGKLSLTSDQSFSISSANTNGDLAQIASATGRGNAKVLSSNLDQLTNIDMSTANNAQKAIAVIDGAMQILSANRAELGSKQQRFSHAINSMHKSIQNVSAARSRVMDADYAKETASMIKHQILQQAGVSVLAQANQMPQSILKLLH